MFLKMPWKTCTVVFILYIHNTLAKKKKNWLQKMLLESDIWEQEVF